MKIIWVPPEMCIRDSSWADENGSIGKAYGYQLGVKHIYPEGEFDQVDRVLYDLRHNPGSRRILEKCKKYMNKFGEYAVAGTEGDFRIQAGYGIMNARHKRKDKPFRSLGVH